MLNTENNAKYSGSFLIDNKKIQGDITFNGPNTELTVRHREFFKPDANLNGCIYGILQEFDKVSLFDCVTHSLPGSYWSVDGSYKSAQIFPNFVLYGRQHLSPRRKLIKSASVVIKDWPSIFSSCYEFSSDIDPDMNIIQSLVDKRNKISSRSYPIGKNPAVVYFSGTTQIFKATTSLGTISAHHAPRVNSGGPQGVYIANEIVIKISFTKLVRFDTSFDAIITVIRFFELVVGRKQSASKFWINIESKDPSRSILHVYYSHSAQSNDIDSNSDKLPSDLLMDAVKDSQNFEKVLAYWLSRSQKWRMARGRFFASFSRGNKFDVDRLIGAANMFDLLPSSATPKRVKISSKLRIARDKSRSMFGALPAGLERDSVLSALGRVGKPSLKHKVRYRARQVAEAFQPMTPQLYDVLDLAVETRNHFVHGTQSKIDYEGNAGSILPFLTCSLEFVFAISDLIDCGWDHERWLKQGITMSHPFSLFIASYSEQLDYLRKSLRYNHKINK